MIDNLNDDNFMIYAMKAYDRPNAIVSEFEEDLKRVKYIKRLIKKYKATGDLKERLILNHIIVLSNVFGVEPTVKILFFKLSKADYSVIKTFLLFLNYMPQVIKGINGSDIISADISIDLIVGKALRSI